MHSPDELRANADTADMRWPRFRERYEQSARFREDRALIEQLEPLASPLLTALAALEQGRSAPQRAAAQASLHDAYALLSGLCRLAAELGATASVAATIPAALMHALAGEGIVLDDELRTELAIVAVEAYSAAREERSLRALQKIHAESQVAFMIAPRCCAIMLAGKHEEHELAPVLERFARELLKEDTRACLLDLTRLAPFEEELARALGRFCEHALTLGVRIAIVSSSQALAVQFRAWSLSANQLTFFDRYDRAQQATLAAAGLEVRNLRPWARLFLPAGSGLVR